MKLDPTALDAAAKAMVACHDPDGMEYTMPPAYWPSIATASITAYLTALANIAHAAADPVDTTEFEDIANRLVDAAMTLQASKSGSEIMAKARIDVDQRINTLVDLFVKAAAR